MIELRVPPKWPKQEWPMTLDCQIQKSTTGGERCRELLEGTGTPFILRRLLPEEVNVTTAFTGFSIFMPINILAVPIQSTM